MGKCKIALLEDQLEDLKKENQEAKGKIVDEKIAKARELAEKDAENSKLKNLLPEWAKAGVNGISHLGGSGCVNNLPVDLAQELGVYRKILDAVGEEKEKERVEEVCKRIITSTETTTTSIPENLKENGLNRSI